MTVRCVSEMDYKCNDCKGCFFFVFLFIFNGHSHTHTSNILREVTALNRHDSVFCKC